MRDGHREYMPSLDGLRAVSIVMVVLGHAFGFVAPAVLKPATLVFDGAMGVRVFFVISGFLITTLLLKERDGGAVSLKRFYIRRTLRLAPVQLTFIAALFLLTQVTALKVTTCQFATALTYTKNYGCAAWVDGHLWSLSVEEQFYLLWPALLVCLPRQLTLAAIAVLIAVSPLSRGWEYHLGSKSFFWLTSNADVLMVGCATALAYHAGALDRIMRFRPTSMRILAVGAIALTLTVNDRLWLGWFSVMFGPLVEAVAVAYLIGSLVIVRQGISYRLLNLPWVSFLGRMSYSLYVWQQLFFTPPVAFGLTSAVILGFPLDVGVALLAGFASYSLIEKPTARLRARFRAPAAALDSPMAATVEPV